MNVGWAFRSAALRHPEWPAVADGVRTFTYAEWYRRSAAVAAWLQEQGMRQGQRVAIAMRQSEAAATAYMAVQLSGAAAVPLSFRLSAPELAHCLADSEARLLVHDDAVAKSLGEVTDPPLLLHAGDLEALAGEDRELTRDPTNQDLATSVILYTSGTTGRPKGVPRSHRAECAAGTAHVVQCGYAWGESTLGLQTLAHTMGIRSLLSMVLVNGLYVPVPSLTDAPVVDLLSDLRVSALYLVPTAFHLLLERMGPGGTRLPACRKLGYAGAPMTASLVERCIEAFDPEVFVNHCLHLHRLVAAAGEAWLRREAGLSLQDQAGRGQPRASRVARRGGCGRHEW